ncbi:hypothetical protein [Halobellus rufus]|uniref:hypothetical protein n=1 Tax=Halobellus rufus TaxID=1448860 RepID=UPI000679E613|nr:hypothetical protein [Halobellus rufus]
MTGRALLTKTEREVLTRARGSDAYRSTVRTRLRRRIGELEADVALLEAHEPELLDRLRDVIK